MNQKGITLIELLVVLIIIGILGLIGSLSVTTILENSREDAILAEAQTIAAAAELACLETCDYDEDDNIIVDGYYSGSADISSLILDNEEYHMTFIFIDHEFDGTINEYTINKIGGD